MRSRLRPLRLVALLGVSVMLCLAAAEVLTRFLWAAPKFRFPQTIHRKHPTLGWEMVPNQQAFSYDVPVSINSLGVRDDEITVERAPGSLRILCLGDSVTYGVLVAGEATFPNRLEALLRRSWTTGPVEVINAGVQRYFTYQELDYYREKGAALRPDIVILGFYINDLGIRPTEWTREYESDRELKANDLWERVPWLMHAVKNSAFVSLLRDRYLRLASARRSRPPKEHRLLTGEVDESIARLWDANRGYLRELRDLTAANGSRLLVVALPGINQITGDYPNAVYPSTLETIAADLQVPYVDTVPVFKANYTGDVRSLYFRYNGHPNAVGHRLVAETIHAALVRHGMVPGASGTAK